MKKTALIISGIILISFGLAFYLYPSMPAKMASHWNFKGEVDGYSNRFVGVFLMPVVSLVMLLFFWAIPKIDPLKANIAKFKKYFDAFIVLIIVFLFYIYLLTIFWNLGFRFNMGRLMIPAMGILFYYCGIMIEKLKRNYFIGIRTPWTLNSDIVWDKTHKLGGKLFKTAGSLALVGMLFPDKALFFVIIPILAAAIFSVVYSYLVYRKEPKDHD